MSKINRKLGLLLVLVAASGWMTAQEANPTAQPNAAPAPMTQQGTYDNVPLYKIEVVARDIPAINYFHRSGSTKIGFRGTESSAAGQRRGQSRQQAGPHRRSTPTSRDLPRPTASALNI